MSIDADKQAGPMAGAPASPRARLRGLVRRALPRIAPIYARRRARAIELEATVRRLEGDFEHVRARHTEQIERLEDLVRELVLAAESLRRRGVARRPPDGDRADEGGD
ncbi:MAG TPA: hypothetical protein VGL68_03270 [Solirubrobacteraceae bacterium]